MDNNIPVKGRRGRPFGHRLSEKTKNRIRIKRLGRHHTQDTRDKISRSLAAYFKKRDSLAASIEREYSCISEQAAEWVHDHRDDINETDHVMTETHLIHLRQLEVCVAGDIENLFGHNITPEFLLLLKEELQLVDGAELEELYSLI